MPRKQRHPDSRFHPRLNIEVRPEYDELVRRAKADAALRNQAWKDWVMEAIRQRLEGAHDD